MESCPSLARLFLAFDSVLHLFPKPDSAPRVASNCALATSLAALERLGSLFFQPRPQPSQLTHQDGIPDSLSVPVPEAALSAPLQEVNAGA